MPEETPNLVPTCPECGATPVGAGPKGTGGRTPPEVLELSAEQRDELDPTTPEYLCPNGHSWVPEPADERADDE